MPWTRAAALARSRGAPRGQARRRRARLDEPHVAQERREGGAARARRLASFLCAVFVLRARLRGHWRGSEPQGAQDPPSPCHNGLV